MVFEPRLDSVRWSTEDERPKVEWPGGQPFRTDATKATTLTHDIPLRSIDLRLPEDDGSPKEFPFSVPALHGLETIDLGCPVCCFVGENGSGKSTLMEALAIATGLPTVGSVTAARDRSLASQARLARCLKLVWTRRAHRGFFLRAEDFFGFARRLVEMRTEFKEDLKEIDKDYRDRSDYARMLAKGPANRSLGEMQNRYGEDLDANSHGESFLKLFQSRLVPGGLYLLDEPEVALSPQSQLAFLAMIKSSVDDGSQFVIATHSPILMAIPGATIYSFDERPAGAVGFDDLEHVNLMRDFLAQPERFIRHLWTDDD
jgi:predicted ATPase